MKLVANYTCYSTLLQKNHLGDEQSSKTFDEAAKKVECIHFSTMLKLNVGGHIFATTLETLKKDPGTLSILNDTKKL